MPWSFKEWYEENGDDLNESRRKRYHEDETYREKVLTRNREAARRAREQRKSAGRSTPAGRVKLSRATKGQSIDVEIDGKPQRLQVFTLGALAAYLGKSRRTLYKWEREGLLPDTPFRSSGGHRLYTVESMEWIKSHLMDLGKVDNVVRVRRRGEQKGTVKIIAWGDGKKERVTLFRLGMVARVLGKTRETLLQWEREGLIPMTPLRTEKMAHRLFTAGMIEVLKNAFDLENSVLRGKDAKERFKKAIFEGWKSVKGARLVDPVSA